MELWLAIVSMVGTAITGGGLYKLIELWLNRKSDNQYIIETYRAVIIDKDAQNKAAIMEMEERLKRVQASFAALEIEYKKYIADNNKAAKP